MYLSILKQVRKIVRDINDLRLRDYASQAVHTAPSPEQIECDRGNPECALLTFVTGSNETEAAVQHAARDST